MPGLTKVGFRKPIMNDSLKCMSNHKTEKAANFDGGKRTLYLSKP